MVAHLTSLQARADAPPVQRYEDLNALYAETPDFEGKQAWLAVFSQAQQVLNDEAKVRTSLTKLSADMLEHDRSLQDTLVQKMHQHWGEQDSVMTGFVPAETFLPLIRSGKLFRDYVGQRHGVHTHQIQWFILYDHFQDKDLVLQMFRESASERWKINYASGPKYMWDRIVDGPQKKNQDVILEAGDFTVPENFQHFIEESLRNDPPLREKKRLFRRRQVTRDPLLKTVTDSAAGQPDSIVNFQSQYPKRAHYNAALNAAVTAFEGPAASGAAQAVALTAIRNEKIVHQHDDASPRIEWTGWVRADTVTEDYLFKPTVGRILD